VSDRLGISGDAARMLVRRRGWQRIQPNRKGAPTVVVLTQDELTGEQWRQERTSPDVRGTTPDIGADKGDRLSEGEALKRICTDDGMPDCTTVNAWRRDRPAFSAMFARAREDAGDTLAEAETAQAVRVKYDALRWYASKLGPKTYGDELQHTGDPANPVSFVIRAPPPVESTDEWLRIYAPKPINGEAEAEAEDVPPPAPSPSAHVEPVAQPSVSSSTAAWLEQHRPKRDDYG
jgi:hypothetical protein